MGPLFYRTNLDGSLDHNRPPRNNSVMKWVSAFPPRLGYGDSDIALHFHRVSLLPLRTNWAGVKLVVGIRVGGLRGQNA